MSPPCWLIEEPGLWIVENKAGEKLIITLDEVLHESKHELGIDPGLVKDGVEAHLQELLAEHVTTLGEGWKLVRREFPTAIGPVDLNVPGQRGRLGGGGDQAPRRDRRGGAAHPLPSNCSTAIPLLAPVKGVFAAQQIKPQARVLAEGPRHPLPRAGLRRPTRHRFRRVPPVLTPARSRRGGR